MNVERTNALTGRQFLPSKSGRNGQRNEQNFIEGKAVLRCRRARTADFLHPAACCGGHAAAGSKIRRCYGLSGRHAVRCALRSKRGDRSAAHPLCIVRQGRISRRRGGYFAGGRDSRNQRHKGDDARRRYRHYRRRRRIADHADRPPPRQGHPGARHPGQMRRGRVSPRLFAEGHLSRDRYGHIYQGGCMCLRRPRTRHLRCQ